VVVAVAAEALEEAALPGAASAAAVEEVGSS
jgi:hypothetical protein